MGSIDSTIVATALHTIQTDLNASIVWAGWTITAYALGQVLMLPMAGRLSDQYGRRRVFLISVVIFTSASLCCGLANDIYVLVALRAIQAIGGAGFTPSATGIVVEHFGDVRDRAVGLFGSIFPIGSMIGPIFGGLFVAYWSWRGIFIVNVPIGVLLIAMCLKYVPADNQHVDRTAPKRPLDVSGMILLAIGVLAAMVGLSSLGSTGSMLSAPSVVSAVIAVVGLWAFVRHTRRVCDPFIPPRLLYGKGFGAVNVINFLYGGAAAGLGALIPLYATERYAIGALDSGTLLTARGIAVVVFSGLAVLALRRLGYRMPMLVGFLLTAVGMFSLSISPPALSPYLWLAAAAAVAGIGIGWSGPATRNASLQLDPKNSAAIAGLRTTARQMGSITAVSVTTAILAGAANPALAQAHIFAAYAVLIVVALPIVARVPEHRGIW
jgi:EmrB/QacA subfamily drug resistance transporter